MPEKQKLADEQRLALRRKYSKPFLDKIETWLLEQQAQDHVPGTPIGRMMQDASPSGIYVMPNRCNHDVMLIEGKSARNGQDATYITTRVTLAAFTEDFKS